MRTEEWMEGRKDRGEEERRKKECGGVDEEEDRRRNGKGGGQGGLRQSRAQKIGNREGKEINEEMQKQRTMTKRTLKKPR